MLLRTVKHADANGIGAEVAAKVAPAEPAPEPQAAISHSEPSVEMLKLQAIGAIAIANDEAVVREALVELLKRLQVAASSPPEAQPGVVSSRGVSAPSAEASTTNVGLEALKAALKLRGTHGIVSIGKKFKSMDDDNDHKLCYDELKKAFTEMKLPLTEAELTKLFRHFDRDANGTVSYDELMVGLRGQLNERRLDMVKRAYKVLDKTDDGQVTLADLEGRYDSTRHPDVIAGTKTHRQVLMEFMEVFEAQGGGSKSDGVVTLEEFIAYYSSVSASVDDDDYFELMIRNVWHISGGDGWCANTTCKRLLVTHTDGTQTVQEVKDDFDIDIKDTEAVKRKLMEQGVENIKSIALYGSMEDSSGPVAPGTGASGSAGGPPSTPVGSAPGATSPAASPVTTGRGKSAQMRSSIIFG